MITRPNFKILVVDDEQGLVNTLSMMLESLGFTVFKASNASEALDILKSKNINVVISDVRLPDLSGIDLKIEVNKFAPEIPFIFMSGFADMEMVLTATRAGAEAFLIKPFQFEEVRSIVQRVIEKEKLREENIQLKRLVELFTALRKIIEPRDLDKTVERLKEYLKTSIDADEVALVILDENLELFTDDEHLSEYCKDIVKLAVDLFNRNHEEIQLINPSEIQSKEALKYESILTFAGSENEQSDAEFVVIAAREKGSEIFKDIDVMICGIICNQFEMAYFNRKYVSQLERAYLEMIESLSKAIEAKDEYTGSHAKSVEEIAVEIAKALNLTQKEIETLKLAARLHDIGKIGIPDRILLKPGKLTEEEFEEIKEHPVIGYEILSKSERLREVAKIVLYHHEWFSGGGYPFGLKGKDIPLMARILCLADAFHALISDRPYRKAFPVERALEIIKEESPEKFDPELVQVLEKLVTSGKISLTNYDQYKNKQ